MDANALFLVLVVIVAISDVICGTFILPRMLARNPHTKPQSAKIIRLACYGSATVITIMGLIVYNLHILD